MDGDLSLPFVQAIAGNPEFPRNLGRRALSGSQKLYSLSLEFWREPSSLPHVAPLQELHRAPF